MLVAFSLLFILSTLSPSAWACWFNLSIVASWPIKPPNISLRPDALSPINSDLNLPLKLALAFTTGVTGISKLYLANSALYLSIVFCALFTIDWLLAISVAYLSDIAFFSSLLALDIKLFLVFSSALMLAWACAILLYCSKYLALSLS